MEVNLVKGKGKQKGKNNNGKGKGKGKPVFPKGKSKGKASDKGKGKSSNGKGYGDNAKSSSKGGSSGKLDANTCAYCGKSGHWAIGPRTVTKRRLTCRCDRWKTVTPKTLPTLELQQLRRQQCVQCKSWSHPSLSRPWIFLTSRI
jgi:hypothetical protein